MQINICDKKWLRFDVLSKYYDCISKDVVNVKKILFCTFFVTLELELINESTKWFVYLLLLTWGCMSACFNNNTSRRLSLQIVNYCFKYTKLKM